MLDGVRGASLGAALAALIAASPAAAQQAIAAALEPELLDSQSVGYADEGRLEHPFALESGDRLISVSGHRYGTREMVGLLARAADAVSRVAPDAVLTVGDLSSERGGPLAPHSSHQSGRDADVAFYVLDEAGRPLPRAIFIALGEDGTGRRGGQRYVFDDARNWALMVAFVEDPMAEVQHVLLAEHLRRRLLAHAERIGEPEDRIRRVKLVLDPIRGSERHYDHFHVRIYCSIGDRPQCLDKPPLHPWYDGTPSPRAVAAARVADLQRATALRRAQEQERQAQAELRRGQARMEARQDAMALELAREPSRQEAAERRRAAQLTRDERAALVALRQQESELDRALAQGAAGERGRAAELLATERRWREAERRRATRLREAERRFEADERRRGVALRAAQRRAEALVRRAEAQQAQERRRALQLLERSERLARERSRDRN